MKGKSLMHFGKFGCLTTFCLTGMVFQLTLAVPKHGKHFKSMNHESCTEHKIFEIDEMLMHVERTLDECEFSTLTKGELFKCFFKRINMTEFGEEGKAFTAEKIRVVKECADKFTTDKPRDVAHLETGLGFLKCFHDATKKFKIAAQEECTTIHNMTTLKSSGGMML